MSLKTSFDTLPEKPSTVINQWGFKKCQYFLRGCGDFLIQTDHRPLIGVFQKPLGEVANPQIFRFWEKLLLYLFDVSWLLSKNNLITDALSCNPCNVDHDSKRLIVHWTPVSALRWSSHQVQSPIIFPMWRHLAQNTKLSTKPSTVAYSHLSYRTGIQHEDLVVCGAPFQGFTAFSAWMDTISSCHGMLGVQLSACLGWRLVRIHDLAIVLVWMTQVSFGMPQQP